jgi:SnoaL-like domain
MRAGLRLACRVSLAVAALLVAGCGSGSSPADRAELGALQAKIERLERRKVAIEDVNAIERLQHAYGYYVDRALWGDVADLFADDGTIEIGLDGVYVGKARIREYLYALGGGHSGLVRGELNEHLQVMPAITLADDGGSAQARWRGIILTGELGGDALWGEGPYENEYVKENGVWKIKTLHWYDALLVPYSEGWLKSPDPTGGKFVAAPPDRPPTVEYQTWPDTYVPPFSFPNPVGKYVASE